MSAPRVAKHAGSPDAALVWRLGSLLLACAVLAMASGFAKEGMDKNARIDIIRGLLREVAVAKVPLPLGKKGVRLDAKGKLDVKQAQGELRINGLAINAGSPAQITKIEFKADQIVFELNNGGRSGKKWYQHVEVGMGNATNQVGPPQQMGSSASGSSVTVDFGKALPDLTVADLKKILSGVLDFERHSPTVLYSPNLPPQVKAAIKDHRVLVGMDRDAVLSSKGTPDRRVRDVRDGVEQEDWIYGLPPHVLFITFDGDTVVSVKQY